MANESNPAPCVALGLSHCTLVAGRHHFRRSAFYLARPRSSGLDSVNKPTFTRWSRVDDWVRNNLWINAGVCDRIFGRLFDRRLETTPKADHAGLGDQPSFAIAPILMLWLGYGFASKLAMTTLIVFFPVTASTLAGFRAFPTSWDTTFQTLRPKASKLFWYVRLPLAIPYAMSGVRVAASVAPIGAVVGEWVGSSSGLGYLMLHANGRGQTDLMFAALLVLCVEALVIWSLVNRLSRQFDQNSPSLS